MKIAIIGGGYWGSNLARVVSGLGVLHTICDTDAAALERFRELYPDVIVTSDYNQVINDYTIEGVIIATPSKFHYTIARESLMAGKDVLVEKPFTLNIEEAEELVKLSDDNKLVLMVGHLMLYHPAIQYLKSCIQKGTLGDIYYVYSTRVNLGKVRNDEDVLWSLAPHDISIFAYLLGGSPSILTVQGFSYLQPDLADVVFAVLKYGRTVAQLQVSWLDPHKIRQLTIVGSEKMAVFDDVEPEFKLKIYDKSVNKNDLSIRSDGVYSPVFETRELLAVECSDFIDCIKTRSKPLSDANLGLEVIRVLESATKIMGE